MSSVRKPERDMPATSGRMHRILANCRSIEDLRQAAKRRLPRAVFDFIDGGAEDERTLTGNQTSYSALRFRPKVLVGVETIDTSVRILNRSSDLPLIVAPFGAAGFAWPKGDLAAASAARDAGIPYAMSSTASVALEEIAERIDVRRWFQCYIFKRREITEELISRAEKAGYETLVITVDLPVGGNRERDYRNHFAVPFRYSTRNIADFARHPAWSLAILREGMPSLANLAAFGGLNDVNTAASTVGRNYDPSFDWAALAVIRERWKGYLVVKGVARPEDAERLSRMGVDAICVSNHGGRQLDSAWPSLFCLPDIRAAVGRSVEIFVDGGIRRGADIAKAMAFGADAVMVGRPLLYGIAAGGPAGASRAVEILRQEFQRSMQLLGTPTVRDIASDLIARPDLEAALGPETVMALEIHFASPPKPRIVAEEKTI